MALQRPGAGDPVVQRQRGVLWVRGGLRQAAERSLTVIVESFPNETTSSRRIPRGVYSAGPNELPQVLLDLRQGAVNAPRRASSARSVTEPPDTPGQNDYSVTLRNICEAWRGRDRPCG